MQTSIFLARLLGPFFVVVGIGAIAAPQNFRAVAEDFLASRALIFIAGLIAFLPGLAIVLTHNVWAPDWRLIITLAGWLGVIGGVFRLLFPQKVEILGAALIANTNGLRAGGGVVATLGAILCCFGFLR